MIELITNRQKTTRQTAELTLFLMSAEAALSDKATVFTSQSTHCYVINGQ